jgi:enoyl-CoA hydratase/carnithine racemase
VSDVGAIKRVDSEVLELILNRPAERNPLNLATVSWLSETMQQHAGEVGAVLIRGEGKSFSAGADLRELGTSGDGSAYELHAAGEAWRRLMTITRELPIPVIVAAHGHALAGAFGLAAAADVVIAAAGTQFGMSEVRIGLFPIVVLPAVMAAIGSSRARELALTGRRIDADEARMMGLVHRIVPADELEDAARALAVDVASLGQTSMRLGKQLLAAIETTPFREATMLAQAIRGAFLGTNDFSEGVQAFVEKRPPNFRRTP